MSGIKNPDLRRAEQACQPFERAVTKAALLHSVGAATDDAGALPDPALLRSGPTDYIKQTDCDIEAIRAYRSHLGRTIIRLNLDIGRLEDAIDALATEDLGSARQRLLDEAGEQVHELQLHRTALWQLTDSKLTTVLDELGRLTKCAADRFVEIAEQAQPSVEAILADRHDDQRVADALRAVGLGLERCAAVAEWARENIENIRDQFEAGALDAPAAQPGASDVGQ